MDRRRRHAPTWSLVDYTSDEIVARVDILAINALDMSQDVDWLDHEIGSSKKRRNLRRTLFPRRSSLQGEDEMDS